MSVIFIRRVVSSLSVPCLILESPSSITISEEELIRSTKISILRSPSCPIDDLTMTAICNGGFRQCPSSAP